MDRYQQGELCLQISTRGIAEKAIALPALAVQFLVGMLKEMADGNSVTLISNRAELTTQQAARMVGVSRPFLVKLLESGELRHRKVGTHRRVTLGDLLEYKQRAYVERSKALDELAQQAQELNMGYEG